MSTGKVLAGLATGAGLAYYFDARSGRRRRALLRDRTDHLVHAASEGAAKAGRDAANRGTGLVAEAAARFRKDGADEQVLHERVRSKLGRVCSHPHAIDVRVRGGCVELKGPILATEYDRLLRTVRAIRGVTSIDDDLDVHADASSVPSLQGGVRRETRFELEQENWAPAPRVLVGLGGATLLARGLRFGGIGGAGLGLLGSAILARCVTNLPLERLFGFGHIRRAVDVQKTIEIDAPIEEVFRLWDAPEGFPRFMRHVAEVRRVKGDRWHWRVEGPAGSAFEWEAIVTRRIENELIAWKSTRGASIPNAGVVRFERLGGGRTRIHVRLSYNPPVGAIGHTLGKLFHVDAKHALDDDLLRLQSLLERGKATGHEHVRRDRLSH